MESELALVTQDQVGGRNVIVGYERHVIPLASSVIQLETNFVAYDFGREPTTARWVEQCLDNSYRLALRRHKEFYPRWTEFRRLIPVGTVILIVSSAVQSDAVAYCVGLKCPRVWLRPKVPVVMDSASLSVHYFKRSPRLGSMYY
ncbi:MAG: hypothetical protein ACRD22_19250, partial [Terriglobia bacterium]